VLYEYHDAANNEKIEKLNDINKAAKEVDNLCQNYQEKLNIESNKITLSTGQKF